MIIILFCVILLILWTKLKLSSWRVFNEKIKNFPGTNHTLPIVGDLHYGFGKCLNDRIKAVMKLSDEAGATMKFWLGYKLIIIVNDPEDVRTVLTSPHCLNKSSIYHLAIGGNGILIAKGPHWKNQRRHLNSTFNLKLMHSHELKYNEYAKQLVHGLEHLTNTGEQFDLAHFVGTHVTDLIIRTMYGSSEHQIYLSERCFQLIKDLMFVWGQRTLKMSSTLMLFAIQKLFNIKSQESKLIRNIRDLIEPIRAKREEEYLTKGPRYKEAEFGERNFNSENFIEKLTRLRHEGIITYHEYRHNTLTLFLAGSDTSATNIANVMLMLAIHQKHQENVYDEICRVLGADANSDFELNLDKLTELEYLDRVIKETLRLFPLTPFIGRIAERDIQLTNGTIPAGTDIYVSFINVHTNAKSWGPNANRFNPDHFLPENVEKRHRSSYIPFSYGPRNCIGKRFALLTTYSAVIHLLRNYKFTTKLKFDDLNYGFALTTYLNNGHYVSIEKR